MWKEARNKTKELSWEVTLDIQKPFWEDDGEAYPWEAEENTTTKHMETLQLLDLQGNLQISPLSDLNWFNTVNVCKCPHLISGCECLQTPQVWFDTKYLIHNFFSSFTGTGEYHCIFYAIGVSRMPSSIRDGSVCKSSQPKISQVKFS